MVTVVAISKTINISTSDDGDKRKEKRQLKRFVDTE